MWMTALALALVLFYGLFTPFWFALRAAAWLAEFRSRRRKNALSPRTAGNQPK
jgi:hypothetical protein